MARLFVSFAFAVTLAGATLLALPAPAVSTPLSSPVQLNLRNSRWDAVKVEIRLGTADNCDLDTDAWVHTLRRAQTWAVVADVPVCWRREAAPGTALITTWSAWQRPALAPGAVVDAEL